MVCPDGLGKKLKQITVSDTVLAMKEPALLVDSRFNIVVINGAAEKLFQLPRDKALHKPFLQVINKPRLFSLLEEALKQAEDTSFDTSFEDPLTEESIFTHTYNENRTFFFKVSAHCIMGDGLVLGVLLTFCDITKFKELEKIKTDFVTVVSHELRTPLTSVVMGVDMLKDGYLGEINPRGKEILQAVESDCSRLLRLVNNLLQLSRMEDGIIAMQIGAVDVEALVEYSIDALRFQAKKKEIALQARLSSGLPYIAADFNKASWVITNLIGNALRYTASGGEVIVEAERKGNRVFLKVKDTGVGISPAYHEKIFQKFEQVPGQKGRKRGGAGLGLSIAREIVEAHGGSIWVESEPGKGSTFTCTFPVYDD